MSKDGTASHRSAFFFQFVRVTLQMIQATLTMTAPPVSRALLEGGVVRNTVRLQLDCAAIIRRRTTVRPVCVWLSF